MLIRWRGFWKRTMFIYVYFPFEKDRYFKMVVDTCFNIYWQASDITKMFNVSKSVKTVLRQYLPRDETFKRFKDLSNAGNYNIYALTTDQISRLINNIQPIRLHRHPHFVAWFHNVIAGRQFLYPKDLRSYIHLTKNPFQKKGFPAVCIDLNRVSHPTVATNATIMPGSKEPTTECLTKPRYSFSSSEKEENSIIVNDAVIQDYVFTLPSYIQHLKSTFTHKTLPPMFPVMHYVPTMHPKENESVDSNQQRRAAPPALEQCENNQTVSSTQEPIHQTSVESTTNSFENNQQKERDLFPLEKDETKSFVYTDPVFKTEYKYYALKANWISVLRSIDIHPFYQTDENDAMYLFFPVKKL